MKSSKWPVACARVAMAFALVVTAGGALAATDVSGRVTRLPDGAPIAGATVSVQGPFGSTAVATTDADGRYALVYDCIVQCSIGTTADGYVREGVFFEAGTPTVVADFALAREATIAGHVAFPPGYPLPTDFPTLDWPRFEHYDAAADEWRSVGAASVAADGAFRMDKLRAGTYRVCQKAVDLVRQCYDGRNQGPLVAVDYTPIVVAAGDARTGVDLSPQIGSRIAGRAFDAYANRSFGTDVVGFAVQLYDENGAAFPDDEYVDVDVDGNYSFGGLAPGRYYLVAHSASQYLSRVYPDVDCYDDCQAQQGTLVTVPANGTAQNVDFAFRPHAVIRARILDAITGAEISGASMNGWTWLLGGAADTTYDWYDAAAREYVTYNVPAGTRVAASAPAYTTQFILGGNCDNLTNCSIQYPLLQQARGDVLSVTLSLSRAPEYLFRHGFE